MSIFKKATKTQSKLRLALIGVSGSGKTYSALAIAQNLGERIALIDTERGSASKYADVFTFDTINLDDAFGDFSPTSYARAIKAAEAEGYNVIIVDSLSHAWMGKGGALEMHDKAVDFQRTKNSFTAWREVTPHHNALVDSIIQCKAHIIVTMRAKTEYIQEKDDRGNTTVRKVGLAPVQRDGLEYEFDLVADMDDAKMKVSKSRCPALNRAVIKDPNGQVSDALKAWLSDGAPVEQPAPNGKPQPTNGAHPISDNLPGPATFANGEDAIQWGFEQGCFRAMQHAKNAYNELKREKQPANAQEMFALWREDVARRVAEAETKQPEQSSVEENGEVLFA